MPHFVISKSHVDYMLCVGDYYQLFALESQQKSKVP